MKKFILLFFLSFIICEEVGSYQRRSFEEKDGKIHFTFEVAKKAVGSAVNSLEDPKSYTIYPLSVYSQVVNGENFKYVFAALKTNGRVSVFTVTVYINDDNSNIDIQSIDMPKEIGYAIDIDTSEIKKSIEKTYNGVTEIENILTGFENVLFENAGDVLYFLKINSEADDYAFVYKEPNGDYYAEYIVENFKMLYETI
jgi:hypothetical protein